ncbi:MAG: hypothetical protein ACLP5H_14665 [Desulfomonilaceae bacterium]
MLTNLRAWASALVEMAKMIWPKSSTNVRVRFVVQEIAMGFQCYDRGVGWFRVTVLDQNVEEVAYMEGANSDDTAPEVSFNSKGFPDAVLREMFQMARCRREFARTQDIEFSRKFEYHRTQLLNLWESANPKET